MSAEDDVLEAMETWHQSQMEQVHTMLPGRVQSYDKATRIAVVKPSVKQRTLHGETLDIPPISGVPVVWPSSSAFSLVGDLVPGDGVMLVFAESSIGDWVKGAVDGDAEDETRFSLHDAVAVAGLWSKGHVPKDHDLREAVWGLASKLAAIGATKDGLLVLANGNTDLRTEIDKLWAALGDLADLVKALAPVVVSIGSPCTPDPTAATAITAAQASWATDQTALGGLLK